MASPIAIKLTHSAKIDIIYKHFIAFFLNFDLIIVHNQFLQIPVWRTNPVE